MESHQGKKIPGHSPWGRPPGETIHDENEDEFNRQWRVVGPLLLLSMLWVQQSQH